MALSRFQAQIKWAAADFKTINTNSATATSDAYVFDSSDVSAMVTLSLSTDGTQASGDYGDFYILWYTGSAVKGADGTGTNKENGALYTKDDVEHAQFLCRLDNVAANTPGINPAQRTIPIPVAAPAFSVYFVAGANAGTRRQTTWCSISTQRAA